MNDRDYEIQKILINKIDVAFNGFSISNHEDEEVK